MAAAKKSRTRAAPELSPLPPDAAAALQEQVAKIAAAVEAGQDQDSFKALLSTGSTELSRDLHLIAALSNISHPAMPLLLASLFGQTPDKARRKALKRALHLLQTRGVPVPEEIMPREEPAFGKPRPAAVKSLVSPVLGNGDSYIILESPKEILGGNFLVALVNDVAGLTELHLLNLKSRQQEELWEYYRQHGLSEWYPVPGPHAVRLLEEAFKLKSAGEAARRYGPLREKIWQHWGRPQEAPDLEQVLPAAVAGEQSRLLEQSRQLAANPLFHTWLPGLEELSPWLDKLREVQESPLVLSDQQKQVRSDALMDEATRALYLPETRPLWSRRLLAMAYYLDLSQRAAEAGMARAAAADLVNPERSSLAGENPFLKSLVQLGLRLAWEAVQKPQAGQDQAGLLSLPGESRLLRS